MKKLTYLLCLCLVMFFTSHAQDSSMNKMQHGMKKDCVMMKDGKMMMMKDGKMMMMEEDMTMKNGTMVMKDGSVKMKDGKMMMMKDGECMYMSGKMDSTMMMKKKM